MHEDIKFDVAIIGAGPAGMMVALIAAESGAKVVLIEKNRHLGKKLLLTGNGRCNITNAEFNLRELVKNYNNGEFLFHAFSLFGPERAIKFFEGLGVKTKTEKDKRVFPKSNKAEEVLEALNKHLEKNKVQIIYNSEIVGINHKGKKINKIILSDQKIEAKKYIICTGGKSYSSTGSDGVGYKLAEKLGHTIVEPMPALSPIKIKEEWIKKLQGMGLEDTKISVFKNKKRLAQEDGEVMFTHFGISGPAVLNISGIVGSLLEKSAGNGWDPSDTKICIDLFPLLNPAELKMGIEDMLKKHANKSLKNILSAFVPERFAEVLLDTVGLDKDKIANNMSKVEKEIIVKTLKNIELTAEDVLGFEQAIVTRGGVSLKEIDDKTMKSKIIDNLFFAGEIIDVDGKTGGFNLQICWSTGYLAGKSAIK